MEAPGQHTPASHLLSPGWALSCPCASNRSIFKNGLYAELSSPCLLNGKAAPTIPAGAALCPQSLTLGGRHQQGACVWGCVLHKLSCALSALGILLKCRSSLTGLGGPENLHFSQSPQGCQCFRSSAHTLSRKKLHYIYFPGLLGLAHDFKNFSVCFCAGGMRMKGEVSLKEVGSPMWSL